MPEKMKKIMEQCDEIRLKVQKNALGKETISNIGIYINKKLNEIGNYYKSRGMSFYEKSALFVPIIIYLLKILQQAQEELLKYCNAYDIRINGKAKRNALKTINAANQHLEEYEKYCDEILDFDIKKDLLKVIAFDIERWNEIEKNGGYHFYRFANEKEIQNYNNELYYLGYDTSISLEKILSEKNIVREVPKTKTPLAVETSKKSQIKNLIYQKLEELKAECKEKNLSIPTILSALESQLIDYYTQASHSLEDGNEGEYLKICDKIKGFNVEKELIDILGKYIAYWQDVHSFHNLNEWEKIKMELKMLGYESFIPIIEQNIKENKYQRYVEERNESVLGTETR